MNRLSQLIRVSLFFIFGIMLLWLVKKTFYDATFYQASNGYTILMTFDNMKQLKEGDDVRMSGVRIGSIVSTELNKDLKAIAVANIDPHFTIPQDSTAIIASSGLLGGNYIAIYAGQSPQKLQAHALLKTRESADIESMIQQFGEVAQNLNSVLKSFSGNSNGPMFSSLNSLIEENRENLHGLLENLNACSDRLAHGEGTLANLLNNNELHQSFVDAAKGVENFFQQEAVKNLITDVSDCMKSANEIFGAVNKGQGVLGTLIKDPEMEQSFRGILTNVKEFSERLNNKNNSLNRFLNDDKLYRKVESAVDGVQSFVEGMQENGPMTAVGVAAGALF